MSFNYDEVNQIYKNISGYKRLQTITTESKWLATE